MADRINQHVEILGGMSEFVGRTGTILGKEDKLYRVKLDEPVEIPNIGLVADDLWEGRMLRTQRQPRQIRTAQAAAEEDGEVQTQLKPVRRGKHAAKPTPATKSAAKPAAKPAGNLRYEGSAAQKWDVALEKGGNIEVLAKQAA
jgi:hypothetical protein